MSKKVMEEKKETEQKKVEVVNIQDPIDIEATLKKMKEAQEYRETIRQKAREQNNQ